MSHEHFRRPAAQGGVPDDPQPGTSQAAQATPTPGAGTNPDDNTDGPAGAARLRRAQDGPVRPSRGIDVYTPGENLRDEQPARASRRAAGEQPPAGDTDGAFRRPLGDAPRAGGSRRAIADEAAEAPSGSSPAGPAPRRHRAGRLAMAVVLPLALLAGGGWWYAAHRTEPSATGSSSDARPSASNTAVSLPSRASVAPYALEVPGPGTVSGVLAHLQQLGFTCTKEDQPGMDSRLCTHFGSRPAMVAYVGGADGHRLGRLSLNVQDTDPAYRAQAQQLQQWMAGQVVAGRKQRDALLAAVRKGDDAAYARTQAGPVLASGSVDGSIVMFVSNWVPDRAMPAELLPASPLAEAFTKLGYTCTGSNEVTCTSSQGGQSQEVVYRTDDISVTYLKVKVQGTKADIAARSSQAVGQVIGLFQQHQLLQSWFDVHKDSQAGATGFQKGYVLDWYPGGSQSGKSTAIFYVRPSCWTDEVATC